MTRKIWTSLSWIRLQKLRRSPRLRPESALHPADRRVKLAKSEDLVEAAEEAPEQANAGVVVAVTEAAPLIAL